MHEPRLENSRHRLVGDELTGVRLGFAIRLALRESRYGLRRIGIYMASITLGVAALVSIHSFRDDVARSVREEADVLMGANARLADDQPLPSAVMARYSNS